MESCDPHFEPLLQPFGPESLEEHEGTIYGLWPALTLAYMNPYWFRFAAENNGEPGISQQWGLGRSVLEATGPLEAFYRDAYTDSLTTQERWDHLYECCSADLYRQLRMQVYPLENGLGLLVVNSTVVEHPHDAVERPPHDPLESLYLDENGFLHQCSHCRRFERQDIPHRWDWVPAWVQQMPANVSHGLCPICFGYYYPEA